MEKEIDPRMHTAEHILNQTMIRMFGCNRCFSAHIEKKKSKCDYHFERPLSSEDLAELEKRVNEVIAADEEIREEFISKEEARGIFNLDRLPESAGEKIRVIRVGDYDSCPCIGPHVRSTGQIGVFHIISAGFTNGVMRIRYKLKNVNQ